MTSPVVPVGPVEPLGPPDGRRRVPAWAGPLGSLAAAAAGCALVATTGRLPVPGCILKSATGLDCPLCGGTRAVGRLLSGDLVGALDMNVLVVVALPLVAWAWLAWAAPTVGVRRIPAPRLPAWAPAAAAVVLVGFAVLRNLPFAPFAVLGT